MSHGRHLFLLGLLLLSACANPKYATSTASDWPGDIPELDYYHTLYAADRHNQKAQSEDDYLLWIVRFFKGWAGYARGWLDISRQLIASVEPHRQAVVQQKLAAIGRQVSGEWAKKSDRRLIYTKNLSIWGDALSEAMHVGQVEPVIDHIASDVDAMLSQQLHTDAITLQRYFPNLDTIEEFGMF